MDNVKEMPLIGYHHFQSKDKTKHFYVCQCLVNEVDNAHNNNHAVIVNVFVTEEQYKKIINNVPSFIKVNVNFNYGTGKIYYSLSD